MSASSNGSSAAPPELDERVRAAAHEAGHAIVGITEGFDLLLVTVTNPADQKGLARFAAVDEEDDDADRLRALLRMTVAGKVAEALIDPARPRGDYSDVYDSDTETQLWLAERGRPLAEVITGPDTEPLEAAIEVPPAASRRTDDELAVEIAERLSPDDPLGELELARELAWRTLIVEDDRLNALVEWLLRYRTLRGDDVVETLYPNRQED